MFADYFLTRYMQSFMRRTMRFDSNGPAPRLTPPVPALDTPLVLYLHVPFCRELCSFCSFNRVRYDRSIAGRYFSCLRKEVRRYAALGYAFDSVYVGGGTPTIDLGELESTLNLVRDLWPIREISTETNPSNLTTEIMGRLKNLGVNRLSVGIQSFNEQVLRSIGRYDPCGPGEHLREQLQAAQSTFDTVNVDMIFNYPIQTSEMLCEDLGVIRDLDADQVTFYPLMSATGDKAHRRRSYRDREWRYYSLIWSSLKDRYDRTSAWCFSRRDEKRSHRVMLDEYISGNESYAGLGAGSFGYLEGTLYSNTFDIQTYVEQLESEILPVLATKPFSAFDRTRYYLFTRLFEGSLDWKAVQDRFGRFAALRVAREITFFVLAGAVSIRGGRVALTDKGYYLWLVLMREFFTGVNIFRDQCRPAPDGVVPTPAPSR